MGEHTNWSMYGIAGLTVVVFIVTTMLRRKNSYSNDLSLYLKDFSCELLNVEIPGSWKTGPFPKVAIRVGYHEKHIMGVSQTSFEYRIVTFKDRNRTECTRWVELYVSSGKVLDIVWEPGTTELPDRKSL